MAEVMTDNNEIKERLGKRLLDMAGEQSVGSGFILAESVSVLVKEMISSGMEKMEQDGKLDDAGSHLVTKSNMMKFIDAMVEEARKTPDDVESLELRKHNFTAAFERLTPLWPFYVEDWLFTHDKA